MFCARVLLISLVPVTANLAAERPFVFYTFSISGSTATIVFHGTEVGDEKVEFEARPNYSAVRVSVQDFKKKIKYSVACTRAYWQRHRKFQTVKWNGRIVPAAVELEIAPHETLFRHEGIAVVLDGLGEVEKVFWGQTPLRQAAGRPSRQMAWRVFKPGTKDNPSDSIKLIIFNASSEKIPTQGRQFDEPKEKSS